MDNYETKQMIRILRDLIYFKYSNVGGALHIVLDDMNLEDDHIIWCLENSIKNIKDNEERSVYELCAKLLLKLSYSSRKRLLRKSEH